MKSHTHNTRSNLNPVGPNRRERLLEIQSQLMEKVASGASLDECLRALCDALPKLNLGARAAIMRTNENRSAIRDAIATKILPAFNEAIRDASIGDGYAGVVGTALREGQTTTCANIANDGTASKEWRELCAQHDVNACHCTPVRNADGLPIAAFLLCFDEPHEVTQWEQYLGNFGAHVASIAMQRDAAMQASRESENRLRLASTAANLGVFEWDPLHDEVTWENDQLYEMIGQSHDEGPINAATFVEKIVHPDDAERFQASIEKALASGRFHFAGRIKCEDGSRRWIEFTGQVEYGSNDAPTRMYGVAADITARKHREENAVLLDDITRELAGLKTIKETMPMVAEKVGTFFNASHCVLFEVDTPKGTATTRYEWHRQDAPSVQDTYPLNDYLTAEFEHAAHSGNTIVVRDVSTDPLTDGKKYATLNIGAFIAVPLVHGNNQQQCMVAILDSRPRDWREDEITLIRELTDRICTQMERAQAESHRRLLMAELNHRVKNTLSTVQSIAMQTFGGSLANPEAVWRFEGRLMALANAHNLLTQQQWRSVRLHELLRMELSPFVSASGDRLIIAGTDVDLAPRLTLALGMAVHELATNAVKFGALSSSRGKVQIVSGINEARNESWLQLVWTESGGPAVTPPTHRGFGTRLVGSGLAYELNGEVDMDYRPAGLVCHIAIPWRSEGSDARPF